MAAHAGSVQEGHAVNLHTIHTSHALRRAAAASLLAHVPLVPPSLRIFHSFHAGSPDPLL